MLKSNLLLRFCIPISVFTIILIFTPQSSLGQTLSYSPTSFRAWGSTLKTHKLDVRAYFFQYSFVHVNDSRLDQLGSPVSQTNHGLFFIPHLQKKGWYLAGGFGFFANRFANENGTRFNFVFEAGKTFQVKNYRIGAKYSHVSNGSTGKQNHGLDNISFVVEFPFFK